MKKIKEFTKIIVMAIMAIICLTAPQLLMAQTTYRLATGQDVYIKVLGGSNIHDWTMMSTVMESKGDFTASGQTLTALRDLTFQLAVKSLKSEHKTMDSRMCKSVNEGKYPTISYKLTSASITPAPKGKYIIASKGDLTIAGSTQPINMEVTAAVNFDNSITISGSKKIQLTEYGIKPPSFMLGTMKVYNDLTIQFNITYKK